MPAFVIFVLRPDFYLGLRPVDLQTHTVSFQKLGEKIISINIFLFYLPTLNDICFVEKNIFEVLMCIFESDTVKSDCPVQIFRKMIKCLHG